MAEDPAKQALDEIDEYPNSTVKVGDRIVVIVPAI